MFPLKAGDSIRILIFAKDQRQHERNAKKEEVFTLPRAASI
jgi:hypothetical protein